MDSILSHIITFVTGLITGIFGAYVANRLSEKAKKKDQTKERKKEFLDIRSKMPELIKEMRTDLLLPDMKTCREFFIVPNKRVRINSTTPAFFYYEDEHENLKSKIRILEQASFIYDISSTRTPKYQFEEEFVDKILNSK